MSKQQLQLFGSKKRRTAIDPSLYDALARGESSLRDALGLQDETIEELRAQARALYHAGKWSRCVELIFALDALGSIDPFDAVMLSRAFDELGDAESAEATAKLAESLLEQLQNEILR